MTDGTASHDKGKGTFIESDDTNPSITVREGMRFEVRSTSVVEGEEKSARPVGGRLCGGTNTCLALFEI